MKELTGDEWREADSYYKLGVHWKMKQISPEYAEKIEKKIEEIKRIREEREKEGKSVEYRQYIDDPTVRTLIQHYSNPNRSGWWDAEIYKKSRPF